MEQAVILRRRPVVSGWAGFLAGAGAGLAMTALMAALRFSLGAIVLPELMADWLIKLTPPPVFDFVLTRLQVGAKPLFFVGLLAGQVVAGGGIGILYVRFSHRLPFKESQPWRRGAFLGMAVFLALAGLLTPLISGGVFGAAVATGAASYLWATLLPALFFGVTLAHLHYGALLRSPAGQSLGRRELLRKAAFFGLLLGIGAFATRSIVRSVSAITPSRVFHDAGQLPPEITPNDEFYEVSKNIINPRLDAKSWTLEVGWDVDAPFSLNYEELKALPWVEQYVTLECISNPVGGGLISNALWRGVPLKLLLERAQLRPHTQRIAFRAADGYVDSLPLEMLLREEVMVAYLMNGEPLPENHGFPARLIAPGHWGMENVKWLTRIEPVAPDFRGYWQARGWADSGYYNTMSRIDVPAPSEELSTNAEALVGGVAFAGNRGIRQVEFSPDDGQTWRPAEVRKPLSPYTWVLWTGTWTPAATGIQVIKVRATDGQGQPQIAQVQDSLPDGATGYHLIVVQVLPQAENASPG